MIAKRLVYGAGSNDVPGGSGAHGRDPFYVVWHGMLKRCYSSKYIARYPAYEGCQVCESWLRFSSFKAWMQEQSWQGMVLDKDLLVPGNKLYGPDTCSFIPAWVNNFLSNLVPKTRDLPMGVAPAKSRFAARYSCRDRPVTIGTYDTVEQAHIAYRRYRLGEIRTRIARYCESESAKPQICEALQRLYVREAEEVELLPDPGPNKPRAMGKLTVDQVREIRAACNSDGESRVSLSKRFSISRRAVDDIATRTSWKHVS